MGVHDLPDKVALRQQVHWLEIGRPANQLARLPAGLFEQHGQSATDHLTIECCLLGYDKGLKGLKPRVFLGFGNLTRCLRCRSAGTR
jgi:hypothetical protein